MRFRLYVAPERKSPRAVFILLNLLKAGEGRRGARVLLLLLNDNVVLTDGLTLQQFSSSRPVCLAGASGSNKMWGRHESLGFTSLLSASLVCVYEAHLYGAVCHSPFPHQGRQQSHTHFPGSKTH